MNTIKIALVDDHKLFRDGLSELINKFEGFQVIMEADNGHDFIQKMSKDQLPDIVLLDINMKGMDGFETGEWLKEHYPDIKILALSMYDDENAIIRMLRLGARGYVLKDIRKQELFEALTSLVQKGYYYTEQVTGRLVHALTHIEDKTNDHFLNTSGKLNPREIEFMKWACSELTYKDIADKMNLSSHTIDGYRDALFEKLNIRSRVGLVLFAIKNKIFIVE